MFISFYTTVTASPIWWALLLGGQICAFICTLSQQPTWKVRAWQSVLVLIIFIATLNLVHRIYSPMDRYMGVVLFACLAVAIFLSASSITRTIMRRMPNYATLVLLLVWLCFAPVVIATAAFCLFISLSILLF